MTLTSMSTASRPAMLCRVKAGLSAFKLGGILALGVMATAAAPAIAAAVWTPWSVGAASTVVNGNGTITFNSAQGQSDTWNAPGNQFGGKAFYSTDSFNGLKIRDLTSLSYELLSSTPPEPNGLNGPYLNIVVSNGTGFSILLLDASPAPLGQQSHTFQTAMYRGNEGTGSLAAWDNVWKTFDDVDDLIIVGGFAANSTVQPIGGWTGAGADDGIILAQGNRGSTPITEATIQNVSVVPEPASLALVGLALAAVGAARRRKA